MALAPAQNMDSVTTAPVSAVAADSMLTDSLTADSASVDSLAGEHIEGIILEDPVVVEKAPAAPVDSVSWIYLGMAVLFIIIGIRVKNSPRYFKGLMKDMFQVSDRQSLFDETVKETTFLVMLNVMWAASAGVLLWQSIRLLTLSLGPADSFGIPDTPALGIAICAGMCALYQGTMLVAYRVVGNVFADNTRAAMWVQGAAASSASEAVVLYPVALLALAQPEWNGILLMIGAIIFVLGKLVFIFKGFRIFFTQISSWLLFLYYLCSLEIIPVILTYILTLQICSKLL